MNREKVYYRTVRILIDAYHNRTLCFGCGGGCAVANLIAGNMGYKVVVLSGLFRSAKWQKGDTEIEAGHWYGLTHYWNNLIEKIQTIKDLGLRRFKLERQHIKATGYTAAELKKIETAFEKCFDIVRFALDEEQDLLKGLNAVFAVLWDIHQITVEDFSPGNQVGHNDRANAIIDRLVDRYEFISFNEQPGLQKIYERQR